MMGANMSRLMGHYSSQLRLFVGRMDRQLAKADVAKFRGELQLRVVAHLPLTDSVTPF